VRARTQKSQGQVGREVHDDFMALT
jgi:hypothetical protein